MMMIVDINDSSKEFGSIVTELDALGENMELKSVVKKKRFLRKCIVFKEELC